MDVNNQNECTNTVSVLSFFCLYIIYSTFLLNIKYHTVGVVLTVIPNAFAKPKAGIKIIIINYSG